MHSDLIEALERRVLLSVTAQFQHGELVIKGDNDDNTIAIDVVGGMLSINGGSVAIKKGPATLADTTSISVDAKAGNDTITIANAVLVSTQLFGGKGNDNITGGSLSDTIDGGAGNDIVDAGAGADVVLLGADDDTFTWNPGDGSDVVEGGSGFDTMQFNGSAGSEIFTLSAAGQRLSLFRNIGNITMDTAGLEVLSLDALAGTDTITVNNLAGTGLTTLYLNLASTSSTGDGAIDNVIVNAADSDNTIAIAGGATGITIGGLGYFLAIAGPEAADNLIVNGAGGSDTLDATALTADSVGLTLLGGIGIDTLLGSGGDDAMAGGAGNDVAFLGAGDDTFTWDPGDGSDIVEGQAGFDTLVFNGSAGAEIFALSANGARLLLTRNVGNITMDTDDVESVDLNARAGTDTITVNNLFGTDVTEVNVNLTASISGGDLAVDNVIVNGTSGDDVFLVAGDASGTSIFGLAAQVNITNAETTDLLTVNALAGDDVIEASALLLGAIDFAANGGDGADILVGGEGDDVLLGGNGDDVLIGGDGLDVLDGGDGTDVEIQ